jgi:hypothetical protein
MQLDTRKSLRKTLSNYDIDHKGWGEKKFERFWQKCQYGELLLPRKPNGSFVVTELCAQTIVLSKRSVLCRLYTEFDDGTIDVPTKNERRYVLESAVAAESPQRTAERSLHRVFGFLSLTFAFAESKRVLRLTPHRSLLFPGLVVERYVTRFLVQVPDEFCAEHRRTDVREHMKTEYQWEQYV